MKYIATQDHAGQYGRFAEGEEIDTEDKSSHVSDELAKAAAKAGILKPVGAAKKAAPKRETAAKKPDAETR